ncbi:MAG: helix-turn-helix domain-containing protein [Clostridia bacterium]|nr:helix-turn-helix domain-containing protein [Clostridia bacterium]
MYKALIIDDEKPVRQIIRVLGKWQELGIGEPFEAMEGESALGIMREIEPEIVLVDMKMPNMNGVTFLKAAKKEFPKTKYIVISGFEDFEYTKEAIHSKVVDYLLKPVVEGELNEVLARAVAELEEERRQENDLISMKIAKNLSTPMAKEKIVLSVIESSGMIVLMDEHKAILGIEEGNSIFGIAILNVINFNEICTSKFNSDAYSAFFAFTNVVDEMFSSCGKSFSFKSNRSKNEIILVLTLDKSKAGDFRPAVANKLNETIKKLEELFSVFCIASIGSFYEEFGMLYHSFQEAAIILDGINVLKCDKSVFTSSEPETRTRRASLIDKKELLIYAFESGSIEYSKSIINEYFNGIRDSGYLRLDDLYKAAAEFLVIIDKIVQQLDIQDAYTIVAAFRQVISEKPFTKLDDFSVFVYNAIEKIYDSVRLNLKASEKTKLYEIRDYIDKNYSREIKLTYFSDKYYLSKEYLSKMFKEEFGYSIYEYVLKVRMDKAKEMMADPNVKIQTVSDLLGYKDNNYFSRAFKTYYGMAPSEYREREQRR